MLLLRFRLKLHALTLAFLFTGGKEDQFLLILHPSLALLSSCNKERKSKQASNQKKKKKKERKKKAVFF